MLIQPLTKGSELCDEVRKAKEAGTPESFDIWWLGQSGFLLQWNRKCLLIDPYLSNSLTKKYAATNKPHVRVSELVVEPQLLDFIDIVTSSHNHTDHLDAETLAPIFKLNPTAIFIIPEANRSFVVDRVKCDSAFPIGLNDREKIAVNEFTFYGIPAAHNTIERDEDGRSKFMGYVIEFGKFKIYHSGDTLWYDDIVERLRPFTVDVAFLPINGNDPSRGVAGNLNAEEAARLGRQINARWVVPHHYDLFEFNTADPMTFVREAEKYGQSYRILRLGEKWTVS
jgi:L-ascorbate metabolism protein UlaG (beta-lactamase superfamily)